MSRFERRSPHLEDAEILEYFKSVENPRLKGLNKVDRKFYPFGSYEGGSDTIGYGHKIQEGEDFSAGLSNRDINILLVKDLMLAEDELINRSNILPRDLNNAQYVSLVDKIFNTGDVTKKNWPKLRKAVDSNNYNNMILESKTQTNGNLLTDRFDKLSNFIKNEQNKDMQAAFKRVNFLP